MPQCHTTFMPCPLISPSDPLDIIKYILRNNKYEN